MPTIYSENNQFTILSKSGNKIAEGTMINHRIERELKLFQKNVLVSQLYYKEGKREGPFRIYNPKNGLLMKTGFFSNNKKEGKLTVFDDKGCVIAEEFYIQDIIQQKLAFYPTGELLKEQRYTNGIETSSKTFYKSGNLLEEKYCNDKGETIRMARFMDDGFVTETFTIKKSD